ncbi:hypothetical protein DACRYDRAFT_102713 [Dacryopinax primogenitus]|uniref:Uncharacterized protein n=1 Tax=Dacryopinax primogenitus (strain DJM 731) TaxID=1858805 RepID=M5FP32_DACPD|nr:uncharacterized protein DACRYDRAFT_102713 [Dacryopinax primogenitus]EJT96763.1 hypothetical protein DACRYDRAFT_102713 [Dacryopinax primogenitus]
MSSMSLRKRQWSSRSGCSRIMDYVGPLSERGRPLIMIDGCPPDGIICTTVKKKRYFLIQRVDYFSPLCEYKRLRHKDPHPVAFELMFSTETAPDAGVGAWVPKVEEDRENVAAQDMTGSNSPSLQPHPFYTRLEAMEKAVVRLDNTLTIERIAMDVEREKRENYIHTLQTKLEAYESLHKTYETTTARVKELESGLDHFKDDHAASVNGMLTSSWTHGQRIKEVASASQAGLLKLNEAVSAVLKDLDDKIKTQINEAVSNAIAKVMDKVAGIKVEISTETSALICHQASLVEEKNKKILSAATLPLTKQLSEIQNEVIKLNANAKMVTDTAWQLNLLRTDVEAIQTWMKELEEAIQASKKKTNLLTTQINGIDENVDGFIERASSNPVDQLQAFHQLSERMEELTTASQPTTTHDHPEVLTSPGYITVAPGQAVESATMDNSLWLASRDKIKESEMALDVERSANVDLHMDQEKLEQTVRKLEVTQNNTIERIAKIEQLLLTFGRALDQSDPTLSSSRAEYEVLKPRIDGLDEEMRLLTSERSEFHEILENLSAKYDTLSPLVAQHTIDPERLIGRTEALEQKEERPSTLLAATQQDPTSSRETPMTSSHDIDHAIMRSAEERCRKIADQVQQDRTRTRSKEIGLTGSSGDHARAKRKRTHMNELAESKRSRLVEELFFLASFPKP